MALTAASILHYWSARYGPTPIYGGKPVHTRSSAARIADQRGILHAPIINTPRIGWDTVSGERRPTMLLESARTNGFTYSQEFDNAAWSKVRASVTANAAIAPDGTLTADKLVEDTSASTSHYMLRDTPALTSGNYQSFSIFAKAAGRNWIQVQMLDKAGSAVYRMFDVANGTIGGGGATASIEALGDGWYRCSIVVSAGSGASGPRIEVFLASADLVPTYTGDGVSGVLLWGAQIEVNVPFPTSYIPTTSATASRSADSFYWDYPPAPQAKAAYLRLVYAGDRTFSSTHAAVHRLLALGSGPLASPYFEIRQVPENGAFMMLYNNGSAQSTAERNGYTPVAGDVLEIIALLRTAQTGRIIVSKNAAAVTATAMSAPASGSIPTAWSAAKAWLNSTATEAVTAQRYAEVKIVKLGDIAAATDGTADEALMSELRAFEVNASGEVLT